MQITIFNNKLRTQAGIFVSHLLTLMKAIDRTKHTINFITLHPGPLSEEVLKVVNGRILQFSLSTLLRVTSTLRKSDIVICRNYWTSFLALCIKSIIRGKFKIHADLRGLVPQELLRFRTVPINYILWCISKLIEKVILKRSTSISCVSHPFKQYLIKNGGDPGKILIIPNPVDLTLHSFDPKTRSEMRKKLKLEDYLVFVYSGSTRDWYCHEEMIRLFKAIHEKNKHTWLLILSFNQKFFQNLCNRAEISNYSIYYVKPNEVPSYLMAADWGFLIFTEDSLTRYASPITFAEYLAAGNKVIISEHIGDSSQLVEENNAGILTNLSNLYKVIDKVQLDVPLDEKKRIVQLARVKLDKNRILAEFLTSLEL